MNLKKRIAVSLIIIVLTPVFMIIIGMGCIYAYHVIHSDDVYSFRYDLWESVSDPFENLDNRTNGAYSELLKLCNESSDKLFDRDYLEQLSEDFKGSYAFVVVVKNGEYVYIGQKSEFDRMSLKLPEYGDNMPAGQLIFYENGINTLVKHIDFVASDGAESSVYIIVNMDKLVPRVKEIGIQFVVQLVIAMILTAIILIVWLYKSTLEPLGALSQAAKSIRDGDLDFEIADYTDDEIGTLCSDFEHMRKQLKENIEKQQIYEKESKELISNISHDLKTPLTAIKGYSEGILDGVANTKEKQERYVKTIYKKACDMTLLVDELSLYAKMGMNQIVYNFMKLNVKKYFDDCIEDISNDSELMHVNLVYHNYVDDDVYIMADAEQMRRVIGNIVSNAVKYMDKDERNINMRIEDDGEDFIKVSVEDNGKGIEEEALEKIFDRFYRTDSSRNSKMGGTGLGLAIAKEIVSSHGGTIGAKSKLSVGTEIYFTIRKYSKTGREENEQNEEEKG